MLVPSAPLSTTTVFTPLESVVVILTVPSSFLLTVTDVDIPSAPLINDHEYLS